LAAAAAALASLRAVVAAVLAGFGVFSFLAAAGAADARIPKVSASRPIERQNRMRDSLTIFSGRVNALPRVRTESP
jgi:hypothetical protein